MQKQKSTRKQASLKFYKLILPSGQVRYKTYLGRGRGKQKFKLLADYNEAETYLQKLTIAKANEGQQLWSLTPEQRGEAVRAYKTLDQHGASLTDAVQHYCNSVLKFKNAPPIAIGVKQFLAEKEALNRRPTTIKNLRYLLGNFAAEFGNRKLSSLSVQELKTWILSQSSQRSQINFATKISEFYNYAIVHKWAIENLATKHYIPRPKAIRSETKFFTIEQCDKILACSSEREIGLLPYVALGLFAGLRPEETNRLSWQTDVRVGEQAIIIGDQFSKTAQRVIDDKFIWETLSHWLLPYGQQQGSIVPDGLKLQARFRRLKKAAGFACTTQDILNGLPAWVEDGLRHTFATYFLKKTGDIIRTSFIMGNSPKVIHNHYKGRGFTADAERFWNLRPTGVAEGKVIPMAQAG